MHRRIGVEVARGAQAGEGSDKDDPASRVTISAGSVVVTRALTAGCAKRVAGVTLRGTVLHPMPF
jgi:hypothetical protein